jgi:tetratricopeptide (TPR) repeat protein
LVYVENFTNNYDSVIYYSDKAIKIFREEVTFYIMKGLAFLQKGEYKDAVEVLTKGKEFAVKEEDLIQIYSYLGELYKNTGNYKKSDESFDSALNIDSNNIIIRNNYSYYLALRDTALKKAERMSKYTIDKEPENPTYLDTYAWVLFKMGRARKALKYIERAVKYDEGRNPEILEHYGDILFDMSRYEKAIEIWSKINKNDREDIELKEKIIKAGNMIK